MMLLPKGGITWKSTRAQMPPYRVLVNFVTRKRFLLLVALVGLIVLCWRGVSASASEMKNFYCYGPKKAPIDMSTNEYARWHAHVPSPVIYNHHAAIEVNSSTIQSVDLNSVQSTTKAVQNKERVLLLTPLKDAADHLAHYFKLLAQLEYPHELIDLAFLISDTQDETNAVLATELKRIQESSDITPFRSATVILKDFNFKLSQDVAERHSYKAQGPRRMAMARARNYLLSAALKPEHSWVFWRDADIEEAPASIIGDFIAHDTDVIVPNIWFHRFTPDGHDIEGRFDYNSWVESPEGLALGKKLDKNVIIVEGYREFTTKRDYMCLKGDRNGNKDEELDLDGIGGVSVLVKADVHRSGVNFPAYPFENQAETEGFAKMAKRAGYRVVGLPNYVVWHVDTEEKKHNI